MVISAKDLLLYIKGVLYPFRKDLICLVDFCQDTATLHVPIFVVDRHRLRAEIREKVKDL